MANLGSVYRRKDGRWCAKYKDARGKTRYLYGKTKQAVKDRLADALAGRSGRKEPVYEGHNLSTASYLARWLEAVEDTVSRRTYERHESVVRVHLNPALGATNLASLNPLQIQHLYRKKLQAGLAPGSVRRIHITLHKALQDAVRWYVLSRNVASAVTPPKGAAREIKPLTTEEVKRLLSEASGERLEALYVLAVTTGMRQGELLALRWDDLDLEKGTLRVRRTLWKGKTYPPKTKKSCRTVALPELAVDALERHRDKQTGGPWLFPSRNGTPLNAYYLIRHAWKRMKVKAGLRDIPFHWLRHTCATLLLTQGVHPKIVSELLGHASVSITLDTYSHYLPTMGSFAADALDNLLGNEEDA